MNLTAKILEKLKGKGCHGAALAGVFVSLSVLPNALAVENFTAFLAGILISAPVLSFSLFSPFY